MRVKKRGKLDMPDNIDPSLLTDVERAELARLSNMNNLSVREQLRAHRKSLIALAIWAVITVGVLSRWTALQNPTGVVDARDHEEIHALFTIVLVLILAGLPLVILISASVGIDHLSGLRAMYLQQIGYEARTLSGRSPSHGEVERTKSRRQTQHEWYEGHSDLNWRDREIAELHDMDVDSYLSNVKD